MKKGIGGFNTLLTFLSHRDILDFKDLSQNFIVGPPFVFKTVYLLVVNVNLIYDKTLRIPNLIVVANKIANCC